TQQADAAAGGRQKQGNPGPNPNDTTPSGSNQPGSQVFGAGQIMGVVSTSKAKSIREFNKKNHYNKWLFIYDPSVDRGGLIRTPYDPPLQVAGPNLQTGPPGVVGGIAGAAPVGGASGTFGGTTGMPGGNPGQPQQQQPPPQ